MKRNGFLGLMAAIFGVGMLAQPKPVTCWRSTIFRLAEPHSGDGPIDLYVEYSADGVSMWADGKRLERKWA